MPDDTINITIISGWDLKEGMSYIGAVRTDMCGRCEHKTAETKKVYISSRFDVFDISKRLQELVDFIEGN